MDSKREKSSDLDDKYDKIPSPKRQKVSITENKTESNVDNNNNITNSDYDNLTHSDNKSVDEFNCVNTSISLLRRQAVRIIEKQQKGNT